MAIVLKEKDDLNQEISNIRSQLKAEAQPQQLHLNHISKESLSLLIAESTNRVNELEDRLKLTLSLQTESTNKVKELEDRLKESVILQTESANRVKELEDRLKEVEILQAESTNRVRQVEASLESKSEWWNKKENFYHTFTEFQLGALRVMLLSLQSLSLCIHLFGLSDFNRIVHIFHFRN
ncbi:PREDICTED: putative golgin subfamily A member 6-like protein 3 [Erythranthe guttata]|uniref:putative golgin subfamily A member 6-like protein 3 n=1 Tax=Erythranthe guttata TaxID=4155 RepID=UPI00064D83E8|nr:PREDICTED: putative golgin subfamily A member 6-like protein 3 [Erythranthe guttata]|eukprot:XP_012839843.1 PREDICTED: putative golgin subfamily A member 6-like protein 3 [Erythranthe guttata]